MDSPTDGIFGAEVSAGQDLVNHYDVRTSFIILIMEKAALFERDAHDLEIFRLDSIDQGHVHFALTCGFWPAIEPEEQVVLILQGGCADRERRCLNPGCGADRLAKLAQLGTCCFGTFNPPLAIG